MNFHPVPFVRLLLPLVFGIILAFYFPHFGGLGVLVLMLLLSLPTLWYFRQKKRLTKPSIRGIGFLIALSLTAIGYWRTYQADPRHSSRHFQELLLEDASQMLIARVVEKPLLSTATVKTALELLSIKDSLGVWTPCEGYLQASFRLDSLSVDLDYGMALVFSTKIKAIKSAENPHAFDPKLYYRLKGIFHQAYIGSAQWERLPNLDGGNWIWKRVLAWRQFLLDLIGEKLMAYPNERAVASALLLGARTELNRDLRNAYADTGATHVLAVSGLHVGLVAGLIAFCLNFMGGRKTKPKLFFKVFFSLTAIWLFALITGASLSVLRASTMLSFVLVGQFYFRRASIYNSLAASAFFLLLIHPLAIWDIGFQLSYLAVLGIVFFQPKIYKMLYFPNKIANYIWNLTAVSIAAQIATLPISLYYFHQMPLYFWLSGLVVIPLATLILPIGIFAIALSWIPVLGPILWKLLYGLIALMNAGIFMIQKLPLAKLSGFWMESWELLLAYLLIGLFTFAILKKEIKAFQGALLTTLLLVASWTIRIGQAAAQEQIVVYKAYKSSMIDFIGAYTAYTATDSLLLNNEQSRQWIQQGHLWASAVKHQHLFALHLDSIDNHQLYLSSKGIGRFGTWKFAIVSPEWLSLNLKSNNPISVDFLILIGNPKLKSLSELDELFDYNFLVFDASNSPWRLEQWRKESEANGILYLDRSEEGGPIYEPKLK